MDDYTEDHTEDMDITRIFEPDQQKLSEQKKKAYARELSQQYENIIIRENVAWDQEYRLKKVLGSGGQGTVILAERSGAFNVSFDLALKFYRPDGYYDVDMYRSEMARLAEVTMDVSKIQQDHILDVYNVVEYKGILVLATEWVDGIDLRNLVAPSNLELLKSNVDKERWDYINDVIMTDVGFQSRMMPSMVLAILRECIAGLSALHRQNVIHADMKPANVMVKQTGNCKIIDLGSSFLTDKPPRRPTWTWRYAPVEVLKGAEHTFLSDLASLGYVALELLSGKIPFVGVSDRNELIRLKEETWNRIPEILPNDVARNGKIVEMLSRMIAPDPSDRFSSLEDADFHDDGAAAIERQLVKGDMDTIVSNDLRILLHDLNKAKQAQEAA